MIKYLLNRIFISVVAECIRKGSKMSKKINLTMLTDFYEITMANGYFKSGFQNRIAYFDMLDLKLKNRQINLQRLCMKSSRCLPDCGQTK